MEAQVQIVDLTEGYEFVTAPISRQPKYFRPCVKEGNIIRGAGRQAYQVVEPQGVPDPQFGKLFLGNILRVNEAGSAWELVCPERRDIHFRIINFRKYEADKAAQNSSGDDIMNMIAILQYLQPDQHRNIANLVDCLKDQDYIYIITEFGGEDLYNVLTSPSRNCLRSEDERRDVFKQIVNALKFLQERGIYHRDLKVENLVYDVTTGIVKVIDFGLAAFVPCLTLAQIEDEMNLRQLGDKNPYPTMYPTAIGTELRIPLLIMHHGFPGSLIAIPPEMFARYPVDGYRADIWALGVILYYLVMEHAPWDQAVPEDECFVWNSNSQNLMAAMVAHPLSESGKKLLFRMLSSVDPANRLSIDSILQHPWFTETV